MDRRTQYYKGVIDPKFIFRFKDINLKKQNKTKQPGTGVS